MSQWQVWAEFYQDCFILIQFLSPQTQRKLRGGAQSKERRWNPQTGEVSNEQDMDRYYDLYADEAIKDWRGLTLEILTEKAAFDDEQLAQFPADADGTIPYSPQRARLFFKNSLAVDQFVTMVSSDLSVHQQVRRAMQQKNSLPASGDSSAPATPEGSEP